MTRVRSMVAGMIAASLCLLLAVAPASAASPAPLSSAAPLSASGAPSLSLVALGDSFPGAMDCEPPCRSYPVVLGELASTTLGVPVTVTNLGTNDSLTTPRLLERITSDPAHQLAITGADIVTVSIGWNDWLEGCEPGPELVACMDTNGAIVERNLATILDTVATLRAGRPTAIRVTTYENVYAGDPATPGKFGMEAGSPEFEALDTFFNGALRAFDDMICAVATAHGAICVDVAPLFNGPDGTLDAVDLLLADHNHYNEAGHIVVATAIDAAGYAPLR